MNDNTILSLIILILCSCISYELNQIINIFLKKLGSNYLDDLSKSEKMILYSPPVVFISILFFTVISVLFFIKIIQNKTNKTKKEIVEFNEIDPYGEEIWDD